MKWILMAGIVGVSVLAGCGQSSAETEQVKKRDRNNLGSVTDVVPMADGSAYLVSWTEDEKGDDSKMHLWYVSGTRQSEVQCKVESPSITAMSDGTALLESDGDVWRLSKGTARRVSLDGEPGASEVGVVGFFFSQWQKERGLTDADREQHLQELNDEAQADAAGDYSPRG